MIDLGMVPDHRVNFGAEWFPRWKYESMLPNLIRQKLSISDDHPCPSLPWPIRIAEPLLRLWRPLHERLERLKSKRMTALCDLGPQIVTRPFAYPTSSAPTH